MSSKAPPASKKEHGASSNPLKISVPFRIMLAALVILFPLAIFTNRLRPSDSKSAMPELLHASDNVTLSPPPDLPRNDIPAVRARLAPMEALHAQYPANLNNRKFLEYFANHAIAANDLLSSYIAYRALVKLRPDELAFQDLLGQAENRLALYPQAAEIYRRLSKLKPDNINGHIGLAQAVYGMGQREETTRILEHAADSLKPGDAMGRLFIAKEFEKLINYPKALSEAKMAWEAMPNEPVAAILYARLLYKLRQVPEAQNVLAKIVADHPDNVAARSTLGQIMENPLNPKRNLQEAEHHYLEALNRDRSDTGDCQSLGLLYMEQGRFKQAAFIFTLLLRNQPDSSSGRLQLSKAYARMGNNALSVEQGRIAAQLITRDTKENELGARRSEHPTNPKDRLNLARLYMEDGKFDKALPEIQCACMLAPKSDDVHKALLDFDKQVGVHMAEFSLREAH